MGKSLKSQQKTSSRRRPSVPTARRRSDSGPIRTYRAALNFLNTRTNYEKMVRVGYNHTNFNLSRMLRILAALGNPHKKLRFLHVAGTKGKGSTCHMLSAMLHGAGYRTGLYTSPHIHSLVERIQVNNHNVSEAEFARLIGRIAPVVKRLEKENPTFFEIMTAAAMLHFVAQKVDLAVLETGLGGRLDSTNVVKPEVCGITNISYDHMQQLGRTLEAIAEEKAGIFKPGVPVISAPQPPGVKRVFRDMAARVGCELRFVGEELDFSYRFESSRTTGPQTRVCMTTKQSRFDHVHVPLLGEHQAMNCGVALGMIDALRERGFAVPEQQAVDGLARVSIPGRLEIVRDHPRTIVDGAHNAASIAALMRAIGQNISSESMVVIFGCSADKDIDGMLSQIQLGADKVIFTTAGTSRSADPHELLLRFQEKSPKMAQVGRTLPEAYEIAKTCVGREDVICITGSFYLVGEAKRLLALGQI
ncbi:MAG: bifunctional folylpolyglutamate synthase/dihydrofolate synthase [Phycisphaerae bacterium]|nr:bifunctional folylpolyglutamate synthase/dihydrofolate synthase [Phycisphaerae bacterium]MCZ2400627.1 bifunctional folylpolyglutamate synthase/dihydrofolate synthase [Phycisphaerae bacterium]NUQ49621.1 bifunctional folylpolyglutamate synthase/dihydrofolate synthase [Phycisphaerae bacterium]